MQKVGYEPFNWLVSQRTVFVRTFATSSNSLNGAENSVSFIYFNHRSGIIYIYLRQPPTEETRAKNLTVANILSAAQEFL